MLTRPLKFIPINFERLTDNRNKFVIVSNENCTLYCLVKLGLSSESSQKSSTKNVIAVTSHD